MDLYARLQVIGGDKFKAFFDQIGPDGQRALLAIGVAADKTSKSMLRINDAVKTVKEGVAEMGKGASKAASGFGDVGDAFDTVGTRLEKTAKKIKKAVLEITAVVVAATTAAAVWADSTAKAAVEADKQGSQLGLTARQFQIWSDVVTKAGGSTDDFTSGLQHMNGLIAAAVTGDAAAAGVFQQFGIKLTDTTGRLRTAQEILGDIVTLFGKSRLAEQAQRQARGYNEAADVIYFANQRIGISEQFFGDAGKKLVPALSQAAHSINLQANAIDASGKAFSRADVIIGKRFTASLALAGLQVEGLKNRLGILFAEEGIGLIDRFGAAIERNRDRIIDFAKKAIAWFDTFINDVFKVFSGGQASAPNAWMNELKTNFEAFAAGVRDTWTNVIVPTFSQILDLFDRIAKGLNAAFGTDLSGGQVAFIAFLGQFLGLFQLIAPLVTIVSGGIQLIYGIGQVAYGSIKLLLTGLAAVFEYFGGGAALTAIVGFAEAALAALVAIVGWPALVIAAVVGLGVVMYHFWDDIVAGAKKALGWLGQVIDTIASAWEKGKAFIAAFGSNPATGAPPQTAPGFAEGGVIQGPGTGTSDSILARVGRGIIRVSAGEGIVNARSMARMGAGMLNAINNGFVPRFAEGGLVGGALQPAMAMAGADFGGGASGAAVNLFLPNGDMIPMRTTSGGVGKLLNSDQFALSQPNRWHKR